MKRLVVGGVAALLLAGGAGVSLAAPGPNGNNTYGLCTAYFAGSETGQANKRKAPPFVALEEAAEEQNQTVEKYCEANGQRPGGRK